MPHQSFPLRAAQATRMILHCMTFDLLLKIISTVSTFAIGVAAFVLAYQQFRISRSKLKFDLYERRLALFNVVREFCGRVAMSKEVDSGTFYHESIERYFLFDEDVCAYIGEVYQRALQLEHTNLEFGRPNLPEDERQTLIKRLVGEKQWFYDQAENVIKVFSKDLSIKTLR